MLRLVGNAMETGFIELLSECFTLCDQTGVGSDRLVELIKDQHHSPTLIRYADRITKNHFDSEGGFNLGGGIMDARWVPFSFLLTGTLVFEKEKQLVERQRGIAADSLYPQTHPPTRRIPQRSDAYLGRRAPAHAVRPGTWG